MNDATTRQYGAAIALVSGLYSLVSATWGGGMMRTRSSGRLLVALLGIVVVVHGVVLLTPYADRLGSASGPLMIAYSLVMLLDQALVGATGSTNWGMAGGMGPGMTTGMGWDLGMVALALLMLISGIIMTNRRGGDAGM